MRQINHISWGNKSLNILLQSSRQDFHRQVKPEFFFKYNNNEWVFKNVFNRFCFLWLVINSQAVLEGPLPMSKQHTELVAPCCIK